MNLLQGALVLAVAAGIVVTPPARGKKLTANIELDIPTLDKPSQDDIAGRLKNAVVLKERGQAWGCVDAPSIGTAGADIQIVVKVTRAVNVPLSERAANVLVGNDPGTVEVTITWSGPKVFSKDAVNNVTVKQEVTDRARVLWQEALETAKPCTPKMKAKAKQSLRGEANYDAGWEGAVALRIDEHGAFAETMPVRYYMTTITMAAGTCDVTLSNPDATVDLSGELDDGTLVIARASSTPPRGNVSTVCRVGGQTFANTMPAREAGPGNTPLNVRLALAHGARAIFNIPRPVAGVTQNNVTFELSYDAAATGVTRPSRPLTRP